MSSSTVETRTSRIAGSGTDSWRTVLVNWVQRGHAWIRSVRQIRRDINELMALDDRMLADIGLRRGDVEHAVRYGRLPDRANEDPCR